MLIRLAVLLIALAAAGCGPPRSAVVVETEVYAPLHYHGYVVYYDSWGRPVYYVDGAWFYVPRSYVHFDLLLTHYRTHRAAYDRWYRHHSVPHATRHRDQRDRRQHDDLRDHRERRERSDQRERRPARPAPSR